MELVGVPDKNDYYFHWGPIFHVCSSARNWASSMYKGIYQYISKYFNIYQYIYINIYQDISIKYKYIYIYQYIYISYT